MRRGIVAALVAACAVAGVPADAAAPAGVVYEIVRTDRRASNWLHLSIVASAPSGTATSMLAVLRPEGKSYAPLSLGFGVSYGGDTRWRTYGDWPVPPTCPGQPLCGEAGGPARGEDVSIVATMPGTRVLVGGLRGRLKVSTRTPYWKVREAGSGFRVVTGEQSDATGWSSPLGSYEVFRGASAAAGPHGSVAFGQLPCDAGAGTATFADDAGTSVDLGCLPTWSGWDFLWSSAGRRWTIDGAAAGRSSSPYRLAVLDVPSPPRPVKA